MYELKVEKDMRLHPYPEVWQYRDWIAHLKQELAQMVAPYGREVMQWLSAVFQLEDASNPVPDEFYSTPENFPN